MRKLLIAFIYYLIIASASMIFAIFYKASNLGPSLGFLGCIFLVAFLVSLTNQTK